MPLTRQQKKNAMKHILENVFDFDEGSNLHRVFAKAAVTQPADILCMPGDAARTLKYKDDDGNIQQIQAGHVGLIIMFQHFVSHYQSHNGSLLGRNGSTSPLTNLMNTASTLTQSVTSQRQLNPL